MDASLQQSILIQHVIPIFNVSRSSSRIAIDYTVDSFFIYDRDEHAEFLLPDERDFTRRMKYIISKRLAFFGLGITENRQNDAIQPDIDRVYSVLGDILQCQANNEQVGWQLWNQELPYLIDDIIRELYFGGAGNLVPMQLAYRQFADVLFNQLTNDTNSMGSLSDKQLFRLSLAIGTVGAEYKSKSVSNDRNDTDSTKMRNPLDLLDELLFLEYGCSAMASYETELLDLIKCPISVVWFCDDYLESLCDLLFLNRVVGHNRSIDIGLVARRQYCDSDIILGEISRAINDYKLVHLQDAICKGRVTVFKECPMTGSPRIQSLSDEICMYLEKADVVFIKGNRIHEMLQGAISKTCYYGYVLVNEFSISEVGIEARNTPLILLKSDDGEPCWWGFRFREARRLTESGDHRLVVPITSMDILDWKAKGDPRVKRHIELAKARYSYPAPLVKRLSRIPS